MNIAIVIEKLANVNPGSGKPLPENWVVIPK